MLTTRGLVLAFLVPFLQAAEILKILEEKGEVLAVVKHSGIRFLLHGDSIIGGMLDDPDRGLEAIFPGFVIMQAVAFLDRPKARALQIGLGAGTVPTFLRHFRIPTDIVDISPGVVSLATEYFHFQDCRPPATCKGGTSTVEDGLVFLKNPKKEIRYPVVKQDWLERDGVFIFNFLGYYNGPYSVLTKSLYTTAKSVFRHVRCFREVPEADGEDPGNLVYYASDKPFSFTLPDHPDFQNPVPRTVYDVFANFQKWQVFQSEVEEVALESNSDAQSIRTDSEEDESKAIIITETTDTSRFQETHDKTREFMKNIVMGHIPPEVWEKLRYSTTYLVRYLEIGKQSLW